MPCNQAGRGKLYTVQINGWRPGAKKITATKAIRCFAGLGLTDAKAMVDSCLNGQTVSVSVDGDVAAGNLTKALHDAAFDVELI